MELTLKRLLEQAEFTKTRGGGYDRGEVDDFLDRTVAMAAKVEARLTQALDEAASATAAPAGAPAEADIEAEVQRRLEARLAELPPAPSGPSEEETAEQVRRTIVLAERTASEAVREAREEAATLLAEAQTRAATLTVEAEQHAERVTTEADERAAEVRTSAEAEAEGARAAIAAEVATERQAARNRLALEISSIEGVREALRSDAAVLERHVEEQRTQLRSTIGELQRLLDDPAGFRLAPVPALLEPDVPDLEVPDLDEPVAEEPEPDLEEPAAEEPAAEAPGPEPLLTFSDDLAPPAEPTSVPEAAVEPVPGAPEELVPPRLDFAEVDHDQPGFIDLVDPGPPTAPVSVVELTSPDDSADVEDDAFLAELRKAMADDEPLGPREHVANPPSVLPFEDEDRRGWRFGKRR